MEEKFTIGVEEEFQLVQPETGALSSSIDAVLSLKGFSILEHVKLEMMQSMLEVFTPVCPDIFVVRRELSELRANLIHLLDLCSLAPISAGTHPSSLWQEQKITNRDRSFEIIEEVQDIGRSLLIFGLHIHIGLHNKELAITVINQLRTWLPHLLALSSNSPFWAGRLTGLKSYRAAIWRLCPRSGLPDVFTSREEWQAFTSALIQNSCIRDEREIWWDIRLHPLFPTIEFRICDMPATLDDTVAIAALCQALVVKLVWLLKQSRTDIAILRRDMIEENKWQAMRYGLDGQYVDFAQARSMSMREAIHDLLDFVADVVDDLGSRNEMNYLRSLVTSPEGTGADQQIALYRRTQDIQSVTQFLIVQTKRGVIQPTFLSDEA